MLQLLAPPLPSIIATGEDTYRAGQSHPNRKNIGVFDLIIVTRGSLMMGEGEWNFQVGERQALILYPDGHHFQVLPCETETHFYWIHFNTSKEWIELNETSSNQAIVFWKKENRNGFSELPFWIRVPKYCTIHNWSAVDLLCRQLLLIEENASFSWEWKRQILFQQLLQELASNNQFEINSSAMAIAEQAASFLRKNFATKIDYNKLGEALSYHPNYIAKYMIDHLGYSPIEYVNQVRLDQSKILLVSTNWSIEKIAANCGFQQTPYFSRFFKKQEGISPNQFRKKYEGQ